MGIIFLKNTFKSKTWKHQQLHQLQLKEPLRAEREEAAEEAAIEAEAEDSVTEVAEVAEEVEVEEVDQVEDSETETCGPHLPSSEDSSRPVKSPNSKKFTPTLSQSRRHQLSKDLSRTPRLNSQMRSCAFCPCKSRPRPVREPDSRPLSPPVTVLVTLVLVSRSERKSKLPSRVLFLMPR